MVINASSTLNYLLFECLSITFNWYVVMCDGLIGTFTVFPTLSLRLRVQTSFPQRLLLREGNNGKATIVIRITWSNSRTEKEDLCPELLGVDKETPL